MTVFTEGGLEITFNNVLDVRKFDDHGLTCMKAVDFLVELPDRYLFIEFKDPEDADTFPGGADPIQAFRRGELDQDLKYKYRDSFLYEWAAGRADKPSYYYVLVALRWLGTADLTRRTMALQQALPVGGVSAWVRSIVSDCGVFNIASWNRTFPNYPVRRLA
jgi:hypothetical protein